LIRLGVLLDKGTYTTLDVPGFDTEAHGINASGQIVGSYDAPNGTHGFLFDQGIYSTLDVPGSRQTIASGINDSGQIVGCYSDAAGTHGFLLDNGSYTTLDVPGSTYTRALGISSSGQIVGSYSDAAGLYGFLLDNGNYTTLDVPFCPLPTTPARSWERISTQAVHTAFSPRTCQPFGDRRESHRSWQKLLWFLRLAEWRDR
jgi:probable HAF family extracellular repeat protein